MLHVSCTRVQRCHITNTKRLSDSFSPTEKVLIKMPHLRLIDCMQHVPGRVEGSLPSCSCSRGGSCDRERLPQPPPPPTHASVLSLRLLFSHWGVVEQEEEEEEKGGEGQAEIAFIYERSLVAHIVVQLHREESLWQTTSSIQFTVEGAQIFVGCCWGCSLHGEADQPGARRPTRRPIGLCRKSRGPTSELFIIMSIASHGASYLPDSAKVIIYFWLIGTLPHTDNPTNIKIRSSKMNVALVFISDHDRSSSSMDHWLQKDKDQKILMILRKCVHLAWYTRELAALPT